MISKTVRLFDQTTAGGSEEVSTRIDDHSLNWCGSICRGEVVDEGD
jgi:hypothetical protein